MDASKIFFHLFHTSGYAFSIETTTRYFGHGSAGRQTPGGDGTPSQQTKDAFTVASQASLSKELPQKVDPEALKNLLNEFKDLFPNSIPGLPLDKGVQVSVPSSRELSQSGGQCFATVQQSRRKLKSKSNTF